MAEGGRAPKSVEQENCSHEQATRTRGKVKDSSVIYLRCPKCGYATTYIVNTPST
jgi:hypothetical protein